MVAPTEGHGDEERASLDARSVRNDFRHGFFTILDNFSLLVSRPKVKRELSELTLTQEASLKDWERRQEIAQRRTSLSALAVIRALQKVCRNRRWSRQKNLEVKVRVAITVFCL